MNPVYKDYSIEKKYALVNAARGPVLEWLEGACSPDPVYSTGSISSLYYDTLQANFYEEKRNSDYIKTKVRLRWYTNLAELSDKVEVPCFLEVKRKIGSTRQKRRVPLNVYAGELRQPFSSELLHTAPELVSELGFHPLELLLPSAVIEYKRHRFVDAQSGARVSLDFNITCPIANPTLLVESSPVILDEAVLEVKGDNDDLPMTLRPIRHQLRREAFSKYARCLERLIQPGGVRI